MLFSEDDDELKRIVTTLFTKYKATHTDGVEWILKMRVQRDGERGTIHIDQQFFIEEILKRTGMEACSLVATPMTNIKSCYHENSPKLDYGRAKVYQETVGGLIHLMNGTRPDLTLAVGVLCRFMKAPEEQHWLAMKRVLCYLQGSKKYRLT